MPEARWHDWVKNAVRIAFVFIFAFELCCYIRLIDVKPDFTWIGLMGTVIVADLMIELMAIGLRRFRKTELHWLVWPAALASVCVDAFGDTLHFYSAFAWYDRFAHFVGGMVLTIGFWNVFMALAATRKVRIPPSIMAFLAFTSAMTIGCFYEIEEYLEDFFMHTNRLGGGTDTADDLLFNAIGGMCILAILLYSVYRKRKSK